MANLGKKPARTILASVVLASLLPAISLAAAPAGAARDISGVWAATRYNPKLELVGGGDIPYNDKGRAEYRKNIAGLKDGSVTDEARRVCVPDGIPRILGNPYPFMIAPAKDHLAIAYELNHAIRIVNMNQKQLSADDLEITPYYSGHSVGHWDGDTLVVETAGYNDKTFLDATGAPHSDAMTTVERIRTLNGGKRLEDIITIADPEYLTKPIAARFVYSAHPELRLETYVCGEQHRDISKIPGVAAARKARGL